MFTLKLEHIMWNIHSALYIFRTTGYHGGDCEDYNLLGLDAVYSGRDRHLTDYTVSRSRRPVCPPTAYASLKMRHAQGLETKAPTVCSQLGISYTSQRVDQISLFSSK
jgi:hypothetical protein